MATATNANITTSKAQPSIATFFNGNTPSDAVKENVPIDSAATENKPKEPATKKSKAKKAPKCIDNIEERLRQPAFRVEDAERITLYREQLDALLLTNLNRPTNAQNVLEKARELVELMQDDTTEKEELSFDRFLCHFVQGSKSNIDQLTLEINTASNTLEELGIRLPSEQEMTPTRIEMNIKKLAQRVAYGYKLRTADIFKDTERLAIWHWEVAAMEQFFSSNEIRRIKEIRLFRKRTGNHVKALARAISLLQKEFDATQFSAVEAKIAKFQLDAETTRQRQLARDRKERDKSEAQIERQAKREAKIKERAIQRMQKLAQKKADDEKKRERKERQSESLISFFSKNQKSVIDLTHGEKKNSVSVPIPSEIDRQMEAKVISPSSLSQLEIRSCKHVNLWFLRSRARKAYNIRGRRPVIPMKKLLQFHDMFRPAYFGIHSTKSVKLRAVKLCRKGRRPLVNLPWLNYDHESDDDWEEDDPGESLSGAEDGDEETNEEDELDYGDNWLAYENEIDYTDTNDERTDVVTTDKHRADLRDGGSHKEMIKVVCGPYVHDGSTANQSFLPELQHYAIQVLCTPCFGRKPVVSASTATTPVVEKKKRSPKPVTPSIASFFTRKT